MQRLVVVVVILFVFQLNAASVESKPTILDGMTKHNMHELISKLKADMVLEHRVKVGVISDSVEAYKENRDAGILPEIMFGLKNEVESAENTGEGGAMIQILYEICPRCHFFFESCHNGVPRGIRSLTFDFDCDIIVTDALLGTESPFQKDSVSNAISDANRNAVLFFIAAGNSGGDHSEKYRKFLQEDWTPHDTDTFGNPIVDIPFRTKSCSKGSSSDTLISISFSLHWTDYINGIDKMEHDLTLMILDAKKNVIASSENSHLLIQTRPYRQISGVKLQTKSNYSIRITDQKGSFSSAPIHKFRILSDSSNKISLSRVSSGSAGGFSASGAISVGAVNVKQKGQNQLLPFTEDTAVAPYSSSGPALECFDKNGNPISPPFCKQLLEPHTVAADGVETDIQGFDFFSGTSCAVTFAGGLAALLRMRFPFLDSSIYLQALQMQSSTWTRKMLGKRSDWDPVMGYGPINALGMYANLEIIEKTVLNYLIDCQTDEFRGTIPIDDFMWTPTALSFVLLLKQLPHSLRGLNHYLRNAYDMCIDTKSATSNQSVKAMKELVNLLKILCDSSDQSIASLSLCNEGLETLKTRIDQWLNSYLPKTKYMDRRISHFSERHDKNLRRRRNVLIPQ